MLITFQQCLMPQGHTRVNGNSWLRTMNTWQISLLQVLIRAVCEHVQTTLGAAKLFLSLCTLDNVKRNDR